SGITFIVDEKIAAAGDDGVGVKRAAGVEGVETAAVGPEGDAAVGIDVEGDAGGAKGAAVEGESVGAGSAAEAEVVGIGGSDIGTNVAALDDDFAGEGGGVVDEIEPDSAERIAGEITVIGGAEAVEGDGAGAGDFAVEIDA